MAAKVPLNASPPMNPSEQSHPVRVMLVDDHAGFREAMAALIESEPDFLVVAQAGDGREAVRLYREKLPDVVLMDLRLPGMSGFETTVAIRQEFPEARVIALTSFEVDGDINRAVQSGARSYLLKDTPDDQLAETIRAVHAGKQLLFLKAAERPAARQ
jgi:DNA-binding NarL/FixJ family response regulator